MISGSLSSGTKLGASFIFVSALGFSFIFDATTLQVAYFLDVSSFFNWLRMGFRLAKFLDYERLKIGFKPLLV